MWFLTFALESQIQENHIKLHACQGYNLSSNPASDTGGLKENGPQIEWYY